MSFPNFTQPGAPAPIRHIQVKVPAGQSVSVNVYGAAFFIKEAEYSVLVAIDDSDFMPWDLAISADFAKYGYAFKKLSFKSTGANDNTIELYAGFVEVGDRRLNIVESRNGSAASEIPTGFVEISHTFADANPFEFAALDYNRCEIWLTADTFGTVWFGDSSATMAGASGTADFRRVGLSFDGFTKIKTKSSIWTRGNVGATVRGFVFTY